MSSSNAETSAARQDDSRARWILAAVLAGHVLFTGWQVWDLRLPCAHDTVQYLTLQYYYLNNRAVAGETPQWIPFLTHGSAGTVYYPLIASFLENSLLLTGWYPTSLNFFYLFHLSMLVDELLLLVGMWLWSARYVKSPLSRGLVVFITSATCLWHGQLWFNFHLFYAMPLILYLSHQFIDTQRTVYALLAIQLLAVQMLGNLNYFIPMISFLCFAYFFFYFLTQRDDFWRLLRTLRRPIPLVVILLWTGLSLAPVYWIQVIGFDSIAFHSPRRNPDGSVSLEVFLTYGGNLEWGKWTELILGLPVNLDNTVYVGLNSLPLILLGSLGARRKALPLVGMAVLLILLSGSLFPAPLVYYWPRMNFFRHLGLISSMTRIFLPVLAGIGLDELLSGAALRRRLLLWAITLMMLVFAVCITNLAGDPANLDSTIHRLGLLFVIYEAEDAMAHLQGMTLLAWTSLLCWLMLTCASARFFKPLMVGLMVLFLADLATYKHRFIASKTLVLAAADYDELFFTPMPFEPRRSNLLPRVPEVFSNPVEVFQQQRAGRMQALGRRPRRHIVTRWESVKNFRTFYCTNNAFLFFDELGASQKIQVFQKQFTDYFIAYWTDAGTNAKDVGRYLVYHVFGGVLFPFRHPAAYKISGAAEDKIQFFAAALHEQDPHAAAVMITDKSYAGDLIVLQSPQGQECRQDLAAARIADKGTPLGTNLRLHPAYRVSRFDSNHLEVEVDNDSGQPMWMLYSDIVHPWWHCTVNGRSRCIFTANLAYKAVPLEPGTNVVHFQCRSDGLSWLFLVLGVFSLFWTGAILYLTAAVLIGAGGREKLRSLCRPLLTRLRL